MTKSISVVIIDYPGSLQSAVQGLRELFIIANGISEADNQHSRFVVTIVAPDQESVVTGKTDVVILPPNLDGEYYLSPSSALLSELKLAFQQGSILCSACAGAFILAETDLLNRRQVTTHWGLANAFIEKYPEVEVKAESILINDGSIISAGGLMSWVDLGLEIVAQFMKPFVMRKLGKYLIVDTGKREQRYYESFMPRYNHGNSKILEVQQYIQVNFPSALSNALLAEHVHLTERTFLRQFTSATTMTPVQYVQRVRVQKACELLESTNQSFESIANNIGYEEVNSFRKVFTKTMGLTPSEFRKRFT